jgi:pimeloyl-ACP methyl ester carboxylesterase
MEVMKKSAALVVAFSLAASSVGAVLAASLPSALHVKSCTVGKAKLAAHCGTLEVFEDRAARSGRRIALHFIEVDAVHRSGRAIFWNPGGPGADDLSDLPFITDGQAVRELMALHDRYDLVFVDNRGTGLSAPIVCDIFPAAHPELYYRQQFPDGPLRACRAERAKDTNLNAYTTDNSADDLDDVRSALGYSKIVLDGGSYGTMFFLDYARRHPAHVESLVLLGVAPPGLYLIPLPDALGAQRAMAAVIHDCAADRVCHRNFPLFGAHFAALIARLDRGSVTVPVKNPAGKGMRQIPLAKAVVVESFRYTLYAAEGAAYLPYIVEQSYQKKYGPLSQLVELTTTAFSRGLGMGLNLSVTCAEDIPFITESAIGRSSVGTFEGDLRVRSQQRACGIWNVRRAPAAFVTPVRSTAPILMISGADDPATPPEYGRAALRYLPNARQIIIAHAGHDNESACTDALIVQFVRAGSARHLTGTSCAASTQRPPFATSMKGLGT